MKEILSFNEINYRPRWLAAILGEAIKNHRIVVLTGARQVGKSTLLRHEEAFAGWKYVNLDKYDILDEARNSPESLWVADSHIIIDEVQKAPGLLEAVKAEVDEHPETRFILSGSSNLLLMKNISESLAGRAVYFKLNPLCLGEILQHPFAGNVKHVLDGKMPEKQETDNSRDYDLFNLLWKGFMPSLLDETSHGVITQWWEGYVGTYLERDLRQLSQIESLPDFQKLMTALALRTGRILNQASVSRELGTSLPTVHRHINLLETTYVIERLPAFTVNRGKRLVKSPKVMWNDPGLAAFLAGYYEPESLKNADIAGGLFESLIYLHLNTEIQLMTPKPRLYYWRTSTGKEVDFVIEWGRKLVAIEAKLSDTVRYSDVRNLRVFMADYPETIASLVLYTGNEIKIMDENIIAVPWYIV